MSTSDIFTVTVTGLTANAEYEVYGYAVDMFGTTTNDNKTIRWTTSKGSVQHTTDSANEDLASARFQMANMIANASGEATITAQYVAGGSSIILWNGFNIVAISAPDTTFDSWIGGFSGLGCLTALGDDPDGDGVANGLENFFGTHPGEFSRGVIAGGGVHDGNNTTLTFTHPLNESPAVNLSAAYRWSKDLSSFHGDGVAFEGSTVTFVRGTPADGIVTVTATISGNAVDHLFVKPANRGRLARASLR